MYTFEQRSKMHKELWEAIRGVTMEEIDDCIKNFVCYNCSMTNFKFSSLKSYLANKLNMDSTGICSDYCHLCDFVIDRNGSLNCTLCPANVNNDMAWEDEDDCLGGLYDGACCAFKWWLATGDKTKFYDAADKIANLPLVNHFKEEK